MKALYIKNSRINAIDSINNYYLHRDNSRKNKDTDKDSSQGFQDRIDYYLDEIRKHINN